MNARTEADSPGSTPAAASAPAPAGGFEGSAARLVIDQGVAEFSHERPASRNALGPDLTADYRRLLDRLEGDRSIRALILTGSGGSFSAGGDVKRMLERAASADPEVNSPANARERLAEAHRWLARLRGLDIPVIAAVDGAAFGAGMGLALQADFVLASTRAVFCCAFMRIGLVPDYGLFHTLPRVVGMARAKELMMTARRVGAAEAKELGLALAVHEPPQLMDEARAFARRLARGPRDAMALTKRVLERTFESDHGALATAESMAQATASATPFHAEAVRRFAAGEPALYDWERDAGPAVAKGAG